MYIGVRLPKDLGLQLGRLAKRTGKTKSYYIREAIRRLLDRDIEEARRQSLAANDIPVEAWDTDDSGWTS